MEFSIAKFGHEDDAYFTHQPVLMKALKLSQGDVLELGCGDGSTEIIHNYCMKHGRKVLTVEHDKEWLLKYQNRFQGSHHEYMLTVDWYSLIDSLIGRQWGLVFIDQTSWNERAYSFTKLKDFAEFIVLHDSDYFPENNLLGKLVRPYHTNGPNDLGERDWSGEIKFYKEFHPAKLMCWTGTKFTGPPTLLASNFNNCDHEINFAVKEEQY